MQDKAHCTKPCAQEKSTPRFSYSSAARERKSFLAKHLGCTTGDTTESCQSSPRKDGSPVADGSLPCRSSHPKAPFPSPPAAPGCGEPRAQADPTLEVPTAPQKPCPEPQGPRGAALPGCRPALRGSGGLGAAPAGASRAAPSPPSELAAQHTDHHLRTPLRCCSSLPKECSASFRLQP